MYRQAHPLFLICETPMHAGSGDSLGIVDMPIQRERHTSFPKIEGSSFKGAIRQAVEQKAVLSEPNRDKALINLIKTNKAFGYDEADLDKRFNKSSLEKEFTYALKKDGKDEKHTEFSGALGFTDARLLLFPVKSMRGVFAWITCPKALQQFQSDMKLADSSFSLDFSTLNIADNTAFIAENSKIKIPSSNKIVLEEYAFDTKNNATVSNLGKWLNENLFQEAEAFLKGKIKTDIVILTDDDFKDFVNLSTEVITRTKISNETGTVETGALFTEEYLPAESVMYSLVLAAGEFTRKEEKLSKEDIITFFEENLPQIVQIGGNATIGKGLTRTYFMKGGKNNG